MRALATATLALAIGLIAPLEAAQAGADASTEAKQRGKRALSAKQADRGDGRSRSRNRNRKRQRPKPASTSTPRATEPASAPIAAPTPESAPAVTPAPKPAPSAGQVLFRGDYDNGFKSWYVQSLSTRASLFSAGVFEGAQAARFEVRDGDVEPDTGSERSEVSGPVFDEGQDLYIRDAIRVPSGNTYSAPWQIVQQLHETSWGGSPGIAVFLDDKRSLKLGAGDSSPMYWQGPTLQVDRWYDLVYRVFLSQDSSEGFVEVWLDGVQQTLLNGQTRAYGQTIQTAHTYIKAGIYRSKSSTGTSIVEHDGIAVGTSLAAVLAD